MRFEVEIHGDIAPLEEQWRALEDSGTLTAFQRYDFVAPLYRAFAQHGRAEPLIVTVRPAGRGSPLMILPLCRFREGRTLVIGFADIRVADYCAPILAKGFSPRPSAWGALWRQIERALPTCDILRLRKLPQHLGDIANPLLLLSPLAPYHVQAHGVAIRHPWSEHGPAVVGKKVRGEIRRSEANLAKQGELRFGWADGGPIAEAAFATLYRQRTGRFAAMGREDVMADPMWAQFYRDLVHGTTARPAARIMSLTAGDAPVACGLGLVHDGRFLLLIPSFDMERFGRFGPGRLLIHQTMTAFAAEGIGYFDLTIGDEPYKYQFGVDDRTLYEVVRTRSVYGLLPAGIWRAKVWLRRHPGLRAGLKRLLGRG